MPWYNVYDAVSIGRYRLAPFDAAIPNPAPGTIAYDAKVILKNYLTQPFTSSMPRELSIKEATLITFASGQYNADEIEVLQYVISFAGVADRQFTDSDRYLGTDNFKIVVQNYPSPVSNPFAPSIVTPMKNGSSTNGFFGNVFREVKPWHVTTQKIPGNARYRLIFNEPLAQCLWGFFKGRGSKQSVWSKNIFPSLFSFHQGNTDGHSPQMECIYSQSAIERLFLGDGHSEQSLIDAALQFVSNKGVVFEVIVSTNRNWQSVTYESGGVVTASRSIFEAWLRELVRLRNRYAHGGHSAHGNWVWSLWDHLFLSSFIFPLLLKLYVSQFDATTPYTISGDDFKKIRMFERMLAQENYFQESTPNSGVTRWGELIRDARWLP